jgi:hypothetical protein
VDSIDWQLVGALVAANATARSITIFLGVHNAGSNPASKEAEWHVNYIGCNLGQDSSPDTLAHPTSALPSSPKLQYAQNQTAASATAAQASRGGSSGRGGNSGHRPLGLLATIYVWGLTKGQLTPANQKKFLASTAASVSLDPSQLRLKSFTSATGKKKSGVHTEVVMVVDGKSAMQTAEQMVKAPSFAALLQTELQVNQVTNADSLTVTVGKVSQFGQKKKVVPAPNSVAAGEQALHKERAQARLHGGGARSTDVRVIVGAVSVIGLNVLAMIVYAIKSRGEGAVAPEGEAEDDEEARLTSYGAT